MSSSKLTLSIFRSALAGLLPRLIQAFNGCSPLINFMQPYCPIDSFLFSLPLFVPPKYAKSHIDVSQRFLG